MDGKTVSWTNEYAGPGTQATSTAANNVASVGAVTPSSASAAASAMPSMNAGSGHYGRQAYYNADNQTADGLVFLNHNGGQGSGVFDT